MFTREDFARLAEQLRGLKGQLLLSIDDVWEARTTDAIKAEGSTERAELLIFAKDKPIAPAAAGSYAYSCQEEADMETRSIRQLPDGARDYSLPEKCDAPEA